MHTIPNVNTSLQHRFYFLVNWNATCNTQTIRGHLLKHPWACITFPGVYTGISFCNRVCVVHADSLLYRVVISPRMWDNFMSKSSFTTASSAEMREGKGDVEGEKKTQSTAVGPGVEAFPFPLERGCIPYKALKASEPCITALIGTHISYNWLKRRLKSPLQRTAFI